MAMTLPTLVERTIQRLIRAFAPEKILVFGSYAKGTNHAASDVDLLVVADLEGDPAAHQRRARQLAADCFPRVDVVFCTREELAGAASAASPFLLSILESAVTVFAREGAAAANTA
jgi:predicted nucleotidyltransferase